MSMLFTILIVGDLLQPIDGLAIEPFLDGHVRHGRPCRRAMPVFLARSKPDDVAWSDLFDRTAPPLGAAATRGYDERLAEGMRVPRGPRAGFECHTGADDARWIRGFKQRVDAYRAGEIV